MHTNLPNQNLPALACEISLRPSNMRKQRIRLDNPTTQIHGRCLVVRVTANAMMWPATSATVFMNSILYSEDPDQF